MDALKKYVKDFLQIVGLIVYLSVSGMLFAQQESVYSKEELTGDGVKIREGLGFREEVRYSDKELESFIREHLFVGDPVEDSIRLWTQLEGYYYGVGDDLNSLFARLRLLTSYSNFMTDQELESANRKMGESFYGFHNYLLAIEFLSESLKYPDPGLQGYTQSKIGTAYKNLNKMDSAICWFDRARNYLEDSEHWMIHYNSIGYIYYLNGDLESANHYYDSALVVYRDSVHQIDSVQFYNVHSNLATIELENGNAVASLRRLKWIETTYGVLKTNPWFEREVYSKSVDAALQLKKESLCREYLRKLEEIDELQEHDRFLLKYINYQIDIEELVGNKLKVSQLMDQYVEKQTYIEAYERAELNHLEVLQRRVYNDQIGLVSSNLSLKEESEAILGVSNERLRRLFWMSGIFFLLLVGFLIFLLVSFRKRQKRKEAVLELKKDLLQEKERTHALQIRMDEQMMENKKLELNGLLSSIDSNSSMTQEVITRLEMIKSTKGDMKEDISLLLQFVRSQSRENDIDELLKRNVDVLGARMKERIIERFPNLTPSELQLVILIKLGLTTKEMAQLKNVEPSSIRIFKHRVKSKLNIPKEMDLKRFLEEI